MNDSKLKLLVKETVELDRQVQQLTRLLEANKKLLVAEAKSRKDEATKTDGGGTSISFEGLNGCIARVVRAGRTLKSSLAIGSDELVKANLICLEKAPAKDEPLPFTVLFKETRKMELVQNFRQKAIQVLGDERAARLLKLVTNSGSTTVSFETKETVS